MTYHCCAHVAFSGRLLLAYIADDDDAHLQLVDEIGDDYDAWACIAGGLARIAVANVVERLGRDEAILSIERFIEVALTGQG